MSIAEVDKIRKKLGHLTFRWEPKLYLDTGIPLLHTVLGHKEKGIPYGRMIQISGLECLAGETLIDCPRDLTKYPHGVPIKDLVGTCPYVYGYDPKLGRIVLRRASRVWKTGVHQPVFKVTFQPTRRQRNRTPLPMEYIIATANHPFMMRERGDSRTPWHEDGYTFLQDLQPGDRLMPLVRKWTSNGYTRIHLNHGGNVAEHRFILSELEGERPYPEWDAHHKDENTLNNSPNNLEWKRSSAHKSEHALQQWKTGPQGWQKEWQKTGVYPDTVRDAVRNTILQVNARRAHNHKVAKVEFLGYRDVYDMTVPGIHNFVANGVVVHNSHGKTAITMSIAAMAQRKDKAAVIWGDVENSFDEDWAEKRGLDPGKVLLFQPYIGTFGKEKQRRMSTAEELLEEMEEGMNIAHVKHDRMVVVLDSIPGLVPEDEALAGIKRNMRTKMEVPMMLGTVMRRWVSLAMRYNAMMIFINQLRQNPMVKFGSPWYEPGGNAPRFFCHVMARVMRTSGSKIMDHGETIGIRGVMTAKKNKTGGVEGASVGYRLIYDGAIEFVSAAQVRKEGKVDET